MYTTYYEYDDHLNLYFHILSERNGVFSECFLYNDLSKPIEYIEIKISSDKVKEIRSKYNLKEITEEKAEDIFKKRFLSNMKNRIIHLKQEVLSLEQRTLNMEQWELGKEKK